MAADRPPSFLEDVKGLRARAREHMERGAVTEGYRADRDAVIRLLDTALATELVCVLRYKRHAHTAKGIHAEPVVAEFNEHAADEAGHADRIAARIVQLGGSPDFAPQHLSERAHTEYDESAGLAEMIREDLVAERLSIETYAEMIRFVGDDDPTTRRMLEEILGQEEEHAEDLAALLATLPTDGRAGAQAL